MSGSTQSSTSNKINQETGNSANEIEHLDDNQVEFLDDASYEHIVLDDTQEEEDEFVQKYGDIKVQYIKRPPYSWLITRPHALNFFYKGTLYRTKAERGESGKIELFLDLMYVGIVANLASHATENASAGSFLQYVLLFFPVYQVWADIKDFMNYYYNEDLSQKVYIVWILALLTIYTNSAEFVLKDNRSTAAVVVPYILCRISLCISMAVYSFYVPQHRTQNILYACCLLVTCTLWIPVIFVDTKKKIGLAFMNIFLEITTWVICYHTWTKKLLKLKYTTALNIEHEVERYGAFYVIAIGEFLYKVVASESLGHGLTKRVGRGIMIVMCAFALLQLYFNGEGSKKAIHAIRRSGHSATAWLLIHLPLIASLILAADAVGDLAERHNEYTGRIPYEELQSSLSERSEEISVTGTEEISEPSSYALSFFFTGGIAVALICLTAIAFLDKSRDPPNSHYLPKFWRIFPRIPVAAIIICLSVAEMGITSLIAITMMLLILLMIYELLGGLMKYSEVEAVKLPDSTNASFVAHDADADADTGISGNLEGTSQNNH
ncbi:hypothetical protein B5S29_g2880 [[Candida] boidinii]|nr:hypothetical protein B5S29_g2880 [[Candida] boidinii]